MHGGIRAQSAMEYLVTHSWMFVILIFVLAGLFYLGVFGTQSPRAQPGSCQVLRPNGPYTNQFLSLSGTCTEQLPQYVASFNGQSYVSTNRGYAAQNAVTITLWAYFAKGTGSYQFPVDNQGGPGGEGAWRIGINSAADVYFNSCSRSGDIQLSTVLSYGTWYFLSLTCQNSGSNINYQMYENGNIIGFGSESGSILAVNTITIGGTTGTYYVNGYVSNLQIYNTTLTANDIAALYAEGIGGEPIAIVNILGWWPLNGNWNDYSGNNNNGKVASGGVTFQSQWAGSYTPP
jgi:hypothetical protein